MMKRISVCFALLLLMGMPLLGSQAHPTNAVPTAPEEAIGQEEKNEFEEILLSHGEHILRARSRDGKMMLEDGSQFEALPAEATTVFQYWEYKDLITFSHNPYPDLMKGSEFYVENITRGQTVHANFFSEPNPGNIYTQTLRYIDPSEGIVVLIHLDGKTEEWQVYENDWEILNNWEEGDRVSIGTNSSIIESYGTACPFILFNCEKSRRSHVRVRLP